MTAILVTCVLSGVRVETVDPPKTGHYEVKVLHGYGAESQSLFREWNRRLHWGCTHWPTYYAQQEIEATFDVQFIEIGDRQEIELIVGNRPAGVIKTCPCACGVGVLDMKDRLMEWIDEREEEYAPWRPGRGYKANIRRVIREGLLEDGHDGIYLKDEK